MAGALAVLGAVLIFVPDSISDKIKFLGPHNYIYVLAPLVVLFAVWIIAYLHDFLGAFKETDTSERVRLFDNVTAFDSTVRLANLLDNDAFRADGAIELFSHPFNDLRIEDNGWSTKEIEFTTPSKRIEVDPGHENGEVFPERDRDFNKISLLQIPQVRTDAFSPLKLSVGLTTWEYATKTQSALQSDFQPTHNSSSTSSKEASRHQVVLRALDGSAPAPFPNILCLHVVCLTKDNDFLALDRSKDLHFFGGRLSISFEEQMSIKDFHSQSNNAAEEWFRRAVCEEIFPLRHYSMDPDTVWPMVSSHVRSMRIWSGVLEESLPNFALLGVCKLSLSAKELADVQIELLRNPKNKFDNEGKHFYMTKSQVEGLVKTGHAAARWLRRENEPPVVVNSLHPTSMYRAATVLSCL